MRYMPKLAPSILSADFARLGDELHVLVDGKASFVHIDVMDGCFVPNLSFGLPIVHACRNAIDLPLDVHLMIERPERYIQEFIAAGADQVTIHVEATSHVHRAIHLIRELGAKAGLALNPGTPLAWIEPLVSDLDLILLMSVNPGFGAQTFIPATFNRLEQVRKLRDAASPECLIEVDGGIHVGNIKAIAETGADIIVAGSAVFNGMHDKNASLGRLAALRQAIEG